MESIGVLTSRSLGAALLGAMTLTGCYRVHTPGADAGPLPDAPQSDTALPRDRCLALENPSFDMPRFDVDIGGTTELPSWNVLSGDLDILLSGGEYGVGAEGAAYIDLNGVSPGTIAQRVSGLVIGARYVVDFSLSGNSGAHEIRVTWDDDLGGSVSQGYTGVGPDLPTPPSAWQTQRFAFVARATDGVLRVQSLEEDPTHGALLDFFHCPDGIAP